MSPAASPELFVRQRVSALDRELDGAKKGDVTAIHQARVATRRLREALPLFATGGRARKLERAVRTLTRALGPVRELDVALELLDETIAGGDISAESAAPLARMMAGERRQRHADLVRTVEDLDMSRLRRRALAAARKASVAPEADAPAGAKTEPAAVADAAGAWRGAARRAARVEAAMEKAAGLYLPDRLHEVRVAVKKLRYTLEIARQVGSAPAVRAAGGPGSRSVTGQLTTLKRAQDLLGRMHDLEILIARTRALQSAATSPSLKVSADLDRLVRRLENECRQLHGHFMSSRPRLLDICALTAAAAARVANRAPAA